MIKDIKGVLLAAGAIIVLLSAVLVMEKVSFGKYLFISGALFYIIGRILSLYKGDDFRLKRLNRFGYVSSALFAACVYLQFTGNNAWVVLMFIVAIIELYSAQRSSGYEKNS